MPEINPKSLRNIPSGIPDYVNKVAIDINTVYMGFSALPVPPSVVIHVQETLQPGRQHNDGKRSLRCQGPERRLGGLRR